MQGSPERSGRRARKLLPPLTLLLLAGCGAGRSSSEAVVPAPGPGQQGSAAAAPQEARPPSDSAQDPSRTVPAPGTAFVIFGNDTVRAEVASTPSQRSQGLMGRPSVPAGTGMLFVFDDEELRSFWMRNTLVSLDIAFFDSELRIVDIQQMEARSEDFHDSAEPAMYALEVPEGWFASQGIRVGDQAQIVFGR